MKIKNIAQFPKKKEIPLWGKVSPLPPTDYQRGFREGVEEGIGEYNKLLEEMGNLEV